MVFSDILANKLKKLRVSVHMTQDDVALLLGMNRTSFSKYENGAANPPLSVLRKLAKLYSVPIEFLIHDDISVSVVENADSYEMLDEGEIEKQVSMFFSKLTPEERMIVLKMRLLNEEDREKIIEQINNSFKNGV